MLTDQKNEKEFILAAKNGDLNAFEKILFLYEKRIFNYIYRLVGNKYDAQDVTQDTFIKLYKNINIIDTEKNFKNWLYKIATNTTYDFLRKRKNAPELLSLDDANFKPETIQDKDLYSNLIDAVDAKEVEAAFDKIKPVYKTVLMLFYQQDLTYKEIAEIIDAPINNIKTYMRRAKQELKKVIIKN